MWDKYSYDDEHVDSSDCVPPRGYYLTDDLTLYCYNYSSSEINFICYLLSMDMSVKEFKKCIDDRYYQCESGRCYSYTRKRDSVCDIERESYSIYRGGLDEDYCYEQSVCDGNAWGYDGDMYLELCRLCVC